MILKAKLTQLLPLQTGNGKNGQWQKQDIIVETDSQYPKKVCVSIWGDKIDETKLKIGTILDIHFELESREFNGKWYTDVKAWKINFSENKTVPNPVDYHFLITEEPTDTNDGLPF